METFSVYPDGVQDVALQYVMRARIERAKLLMLTTSEGLSEIALACGLADQSHVSRLFIGSKARPRPCGDADKWIRELQEVGLIQPGALINPR